MPDDFRGQRVVVMGLGRFGGGLGVTRFLCAEGAQVLVTDLANADELAEPLAALAPLIDAGQVELRLGEHLVEDFERADLVVVNPAAPRPWENPYLRAASVAGVLITSEIVLAIDRLGDERRVVGVTGTTGKSTTAAMTAAALGGTGDPVLLGGNIGGSLLEDIDALRSARYVVLELSSAMLHWIHVSGRRWSPGVAVVTNFAPNHLDWHGTLDAYRECKAWILHDQRAGDTAVLGAGVRDWATRPDVTRCVIEEDDALPGLTCPGLHNGLNGAAALAAAVGAAGQALPIERAIEAIAAFPGLPHRLKLVAEGGGVRFYDDSKSTTPDATRTALRALGESAPLDTVRLICGGYDKGIDLTPLARFAGELGAVHAIGQTAATIGRHAEALELKDRVRMHATLDEAFASIVQDAKPGDRVLLSPGCASWDQFTDYRERGDRFAQLARRHTERTSPTGSASS